MPQNIIFIALLWCSTISLIQNMDTDYRRNVLWIILTSENDHLHTKSIQLIKNQELNVEGEHTNIYIYVIIL
jgi:hypothetical protein